MKSTYLFTMRSLIWTSLLLFTYSPSFSQHIEETLAFADNLYHQKQYKQALIEYQRVWLFNANDSLTGYLYNRISDVHMQQGNLADAINFKELAYKSTPNLSEKEHYFMESIVLGLMMGQYRQVIRKSLGIVFPQNEEREKEKTLYLGIAYYGLGEFDQAKKYFMSIAQDSMAVKELFNTKKLYRPHPKTAQILSGVLPGTGQYYAGDIKNGMNSSTLLGGIAYLGYIVLSRYGFLNTVISIVPLYQRYYMGGISNAKRSAEKKLAKNREMILKKVLHELKN